MIRKQMKSLAAAGVVVVACLVPDIALAQTGEQPNGTQTPPAAMSKDCAAPADPSQKRDRVPEPGDDLSGKLENCDGVLKAPEAGDKGIVTPAPQTGNSRVIKPDDVPENANPSNGSGG